MSKKKISHVHKDVAEVAKEACNELYDSVMSNNWVFDEWKRQHPGASAKTLRAAFVKRNWDKCIPLARATMARLLAASSDPALTERVYNALVLDNELVMGRNSPSILMGTTNVGDNTKH